MSVPGLDTLRLGVTTTQAVSGALVLDVSQANTIIVAVSSDIASIAFAGFPQNGQSERVTVYFEQDSVGGHAIGGWATNVKWQAAAPPTFSQGPSAIDCVVFDSVNGGVSVLGNLVGLSYL